jgi:drug/metabolite transporter (DMT)-like permease
MRRTVFYLAAAAFLFSTMEIILKITALSFNPVQITFSRFLAGGLALLPFALLSLKKRHIRLDANACLLFAFSGFICVGISMICYQISIIYINASVIAVLFSCNPIFATVLAGVLLKERLNMPVVIALALQIVGTILIINPRQMNLNLSGIILALIAMISFAFYAVLNKRPCQKYGALTVTAFSFIFGGAEILVLSLFTHITAISSFMLRVNLEIFSAIPLFSGYSADIFWQIVYIYFGVTCGGYLAYLKALELSSVSTVSLIFFFKPVLAPLLSFFILKEYIPPNMLSGIAIILAGALFSLYGHRKIEKMSRLL